MSKIINGATLNVPVNDVGKDRNCGISEAITEINGNVSIYGSLTSGNVKLINLKINGTLSANIGNGKVNFENVTSKETKLI